MKRALAVAMVAGILMGAAATRAWAETRRIAVIVGSNRGDASHPVLRYAEQDAAKLAAVLGELGGIAADDLILLRGRSLGEVRAALNEASRRVAEWHAHQRGQTVLVFYFSGHSDGQVLEIAGGALPFAELRRSLVASAADVRVVIVDSCRSGALLALKGGTLGQPFDIRLADDLASTGEALVASSAADEAALESAEIGASFFSHHFISGLRGAADLSGDGLVTLAEAFQYASARTLRATSDTIVGPQHAAYDYRLAGRGELVLTELRQPSAVLDLPPEFDRLLLVSTAREQTIAEIGPRSARRIAVPAGNYELRGWRGTHAFGAHLEVANGRELKVAAEFLHPLPATTAALKGEGGPEAVVTSAPTAGGGGNPGPWALTAALGLAEGVAQGATLGIARFGIERRAADGRGRLSAAVVGGSAHAGGLRENRAALEVAPSWWLGRRAVHFGVGIAGGGGIAFERTDGGRLHWSGLGWVGPLGAIEVALGGQSAASLSASLPATVLRRDNDLTFTLLPTAWLGVSTRF